jgi:putative chitinase
MATTCFNLVSMTQPAVLLRFCTPATQPRPGIATLLGMMAPDTATWASLPELAYALATIKWETAHTFEPIHELGSLSYFDKYEPGTPLGRELGNTERGDGFLFRGRGYVQITGRGNYGRISGLIGEDLLSDPDRALEPEMAYRIAAGGMKGGWFTGVRLEEFFPAGAAPDYVHARRVINGLDHAEDIAAIAQQFEALLSPDRQAQLASA